MFINVPSQRGDGGGVVVAAGWGDGGVGDLLNEFQSVSLTELLRCPVTL